MWLLLATWPKMLRAYEPKFGVSQLVVALVFSLVVTFGMSAGILWYARRRVEGTELSWGEAMVGAVYVFFLAFLAYGVVPHQWLTLAENEWSWRGDRIVYGLGNFLKPISEGGHFPFDITYRTISDTIAVVFYGIFIGGQVVLFGKWQSRAKDASDRSKAALEQTSSFGRPLIKQG